MPFYTEIREKNLKILVCSLQLINSHTLSCCVNELCSQRAFFTPPEVSLCLPKECCRQDVFPPAPQQQSASGPYANNFHLVSRPFVF